MPERIENRMVVDSEWELIAPPEVKEILWEKGYHEYGTGNFVPESQAYEYALERCLYGTEEETAEFKQMLTEWFYSGGGWRKDGRERC